LLSKLQQVISRLETNKRYINSKINDLEREKKDLIFHL